MQGYSSIPNKIKYDSNLTPMTRLLYSDISALCKQKGYCWATNAYFAKLYNINEKTVTRCINELKQNGYITISGKRNIFVTEKQDDINDDMSF